MEDVMPSRLEALRNQIPPLKSKPLVLVKDRDLSKRDIADNYLDNGIPDNIIYDLAFARRYMFDQTVISRKFGTSRFDIAHSAIYLQPLDPIYLQSIDKPLVIGRLPPFFQKIGRVNKNPLKTEMSNETHFWFLSWRDFEVVFPSDESRILVYGHEVKAALSIANKTICEGQIGDMLHSNCYSSCIVALSELICLVATRRAVSYHLNAASIQGLFGLIHRYSINYFSLGVGNNSAVLASIGKAIYTTRQMGYGYLLNNTDSSSRYYQMRV